MTFCTQTTETGWFTRSAYYQLVLTDEALVGLLLAGSSLAEWRTRWAASDRTKPPPEQALARLAARYQRLGPAAAVVECSLNFALRWDDVHEVVVGGHRGTEVVFYTKARNWIGQRRRRVFRVESYLDGDPDLVMADFERELNGRVQVRR